jgi:hypothetical protein
MLDKIPAWLRHLAIIFAGAFATVIAKAVAAAGGASGVHWNTVLWAGIDAGVAAVFVVVSLWATPLTKQYGVAAAPATELRVK